MPRLKALKTTILQTCKKSKVGRAATSSPPDIFYHLGTTRSPSLKKQRMDIRTRRRIYPGGFADNLALSALSASAFMAHPAFFFLGHMAVL